MGFFTTQVLLSSIIMLVASGVMGMAGLGAASFFVIALVWMGYPITEAGAIALFLNAASLLLTSIQYIRIRSVDWKLGVPLILVSLVTAPLGAILSGHTAHGALLLAFGIFLAGSSLMMLFYKPPQNRAQMSPVKGGVLGSVLGGVAGFLGGLLGVGGGAVVLPSLNFIGLAPRLAAGTTAVVALTSSLAGFFGHQAHLSIGYLALGWFTIVSLAGSFVGSLFTRKIPAKRLKQIIGVVLFIIALRVIVSVLFK